MPDKDIVMEKAPSPADSEFIREEINRFNITRTGQPFGGEVAAFIRDDLGNILAGIYGFCWGNCLRIETLWVREDQRGRNYGTRLLQAAEAEGKTRGCKLAFLETHSFQAPEFYQKQGYEVFGVLEDYPAGHQQIFFKKRLV